MVYLIGSVLAFVSTYLGVEIIRRWAVKRNRLDIPNARSSHVAPTPRGGGLAMVVVTVVGGGGGGSNNEG